MFKNKLFITFLWVLLVTILPSIVWAQQDPDVSIENINIKMDFVEEMIESAPSSDIQQSWIKEYYRLLDKVYPTNSSNTFNDNNWEWDDSTELSQIDYTIFCIKLIIFILFIVLIYIYLGITRTRIAKRFQIKNTWFAWFPILRTILKFQIADMSGWLTILQIIPIVGIVLNIVTLMRTSRKCGYNELLGLLALIPFAKFILIGIFAFKIKTLK